MPPPLTPPSPPTRAYSWYALGLLALINLLNYIDRNVIYALFEPIKHDLALTDSQLGWLGSAYIFVFSVSALPFGVLSDLRSRRAVIAGGVTVWSAFTFLSGLVNSFGQLFTCRAVVGVGEAAYGPAAASLVADYFPARGRAVAMGILSSGIALGGVLGLLLGGWLEGAYGWRVAFMTVGVPGFICALMVSRLVDPTRSPARLTVRSFLRDFEIGVLPLLRNLWPLLASVAVGGAGAWWLDRAYGADSKVDIAVFSGAVGLGLALTILRWVFRTPGDGGDDTVFGSGISGAFDDIARAGRTVLHTPTLVYIFSAGAMISFGLNGIVGWGPTFVSRELELSSAESAELLGKWGLIAGTAGTLFGGVLADWLRRRYETARVIVVAARPAAGRAARALASHDSRPGPVPGSIRARVLLPVVVQRTDDGRDLRRGAGANQCDRRRRLPAVHPPRGRRDRAAARGKPERPVRARPGGAAAAGGGDRGGPHGARGDPDGGTGHAPAGGGEVTDAAHHLALRNTSSSSSSYIASARSGSFDRIASAAQCFRWFCSSDRLTPRSASCTDETWISTSAQ